MEEYLLAEALLRNPDLNMKSVEEIIDAYENWGGSHEEFVAELSCKAEIHSVEALGKWLKPKEKEEDEPAPKAEKDWTNKCEIVGPIVIKNDEKRIATAPVLVPGEEDTDGETVTKERVEDVALEFMEHYQIIDVGHSFNKIGVPVESWLTRKQEQFGDVVIPEGTWMMTVKVNDDEAWAGIKDGTYKGFSITAVKRAEIENAMKANKSIALKGKTLLKDLGDDWVVGTVAVVEGPAVLKSKWIAIKSGRVRVGLKEWFKSRFGNNEDKTSNKNETEELEMDEAKLTEVIGAAVKQSAEEIMALLKEMDGRLTKLESTGKDEDPVVDPEALKDKDKDTSKKDGLDLSIPIAEAKGELLALYEKPKAEIENKKEHDEAILTVKNRIGVMEGLVMTDKVDDDDKDAATVADALKAKKAATKSREISGQDGATDAVAVPAKDDIQRDINGCVIN
jgi:hypothetical protein